MKAPRLSAVFILSIAGLFAPAVQAASTSWTGADDLSDSNWSNDFNWASALAPGSVGGTTNADIATFTGLVGPAASTAIVIDSGRNVGGITFNNGAASFTLSGGPLVLTPAGTIQILTGGAATNEIVNSDLQLAGTGTYNIFNSSTSTGSTSSLKINGNVTNTGIGTTATLNLSGTNKSSGNLVSGVISDGVVTPGDGTKVALTKNNDSAWELSGANTYSGGTTVGGSAGKLVISNGSALGTGNVLITSGAQANTNGLQLKGNISVTGPATTTFNFARTSPDNGGTSGQLENLSGSNSYGGAIVGQGGNMIIMSLSGKLTLTGSVTDTETTGAGTVYKALVLSGAGDGEVSGRIFRYTGSGNKMIEVIKQQAGTWVISNPSGTAGSNNTYQRNTVTGGTLLVNGNNTGVTNLSTIGGTDATKPAPTFGGNGINGGAFTFNQISFLSPGAAALTPGTITFNSTVDISPMAGGAGGGLLFDLDAVGASDLVSMPTASRALTIGAGVLGLNDFNFNLLPGFGAGTYTLFDTATNIVGTLDPSNLTGVLGGYGVTLGIDPNGQDIFLAVAAVPEPSSYLFLGVGLAAFAAVRRHQRRSSGR